MYRWNSESPILKANKTRLFCLLVQKVAGIKVANTSSRLSYEVEKCARSKRNYKAACTKSGTLNPFLYKLFAQHWIPAGIIILSNVRDTGSAIVYSNPLILLGSCVRIIWRHEKVEPKCSTFFSVYNSHKKYLTSQKSWKSWAKMLNILFSS